MVHQAIYDRFVATMKEKVGALSQGCTLDGDVDCGAMTMGEAQVGYLYSTDIAFSFRWRWRSSYPLSCLGGWYPETGG